MNGFSLQDLDHAVGRSAAPLARLQGAHLLLTGGTGFFGQWLLATILQANKALGLGIRVTVPTRALKTFALKCPDLASATGVTFVECDVRDLSPPQQAYTHVIHAATDTSQAADSHPLDLLDIIVAGTRRVLDLAAECSAADILVVSSGAIYGAQDATENVPETHNGACDPLDQRSTYGESKRMAEQLCAIYRAQYGLRPRIARCFAFVGPGMPLGAHFAIGNFIADAVAGRPIRISGDGTPLRSYLYAADLAAWLLKILVDGGPGRAYNVGSDEAYSIRELAQVVARVVPEAQGIFVAQQPQSGGFRSRYVPSVERARSELGLDVWTPLDAAIERTAAWARSKDKTQAA